MLLPLPFTRELNDLFQKDRRIPLKILGGMFVGGFCALGSIDHMSDVLAACTIMASSMVGAIVVLALCLKDVVRRRINEGQTVSLVLRAYLASGGTSLFLWIASAVLGTWVVIMLTL